MALASDRHLVCFVLLSQLFRTHVSLGAVSFGAVLFGAFILD